MAPYITIAVNYLAEVHDLMPKYAQDSGQAAPRDSVAIFGPGGVAVGTVNHSHVTAAGSVAGNMVTGRSDNWASDELAMALHALADAIKREPTLDERSRTELLNNVSVIATEASAPQEPEKRNRAKIAMRTIITAASTSSQLAQAISTCYEAFDKLF